MRRRHNIATEQNAIAGKQTLPLASNPERPRYLANIHLLGKYGSSSLVATTADFATFHATLMYLGASPVLATIIGRAIGSVFAFLLHRSWVFRHSKNRDSNFLKLKYVLGIFAGMGLNAAGVWLLNSIGGVEPWPARITAATTVWLFGFLFNKKIVFG